MGLPRTHVYEGSRRTNVQHSEQELILLRRMDPQQCQDSSVRHPSTRTQDVPPSSATPLPSRSCSSAFRDSSLLCSVARLSFTGTLVRVWTKWSSLRLNPT